MARLPYTNFHDINLDWLIKRVMPAYTPDNPPPYPVRSVNGKTGVVLLTGGDIPFSEEFPQSSVLDFCDYAIQSIDDLGATMMSKQDAPSLVGSPGQVLGLDADQNPVWLNQPNPESIIDDNAGLGDRTKVYSADHVTGLISPIIDDIDELNSAIEIQNTSGNIDTFANNALRVITPTSSSNGWVLVPSSGLCKSDSNYKLKKYAITPGVQYYIVSDNYWQFQNDASVPSSGPSNRVGETYGKFSGYVKVPSNATYIVLSTPKTDGIGNVYQANFGKDLAWWNVTPGGITIKGADLVINENGFSLYHNGYIYYIAPIDHTTITTFTGSGKNKALMLNTANLGTAGQRTNPSSVLSIVPVSNNALEANMGCIPVAYWYESEWKFISPFTFFEDYSKNQLKLNVKVSNVFDDIQLVAHKGGNSGTANTIANFMQAISDGYKVLEMDVRITSDNVAVLSHDATFTVNGVTYTISNETYDTLIAAEPNLAKLWDALLLCKQNGVIADIDFTKDTSNDSINATFDCITNLGMQGRCFITCSNAVARKFLAKSHALCICISDVSTTSQVDNFADIAKTALLSICSINYDNVTENLLNYMHTKGFLTKVWTINSTGTINTIFNYGCDMIITDSVKPSDV